MFLRFLGKGPSDAEVEAWLGRLKHIVAEGGTIDLVQVYSVARIPARPSISMLEESQLERIADGVRSLGIRAEVFPGRPT
jgi:hypothetical protein